MFKQIFHVVLVIIVLTLSAPVHGQHVETPTTASQTIAGISNPSVYKNRLGAIQAGAIAAKTLGSFPYASQWRTGSGNNGIANAFSSLGGASGTVVVDPSYSSAESGFSSVSSLQQMFDYRNGTLFHYGLNWPIISIGGSPCGANADLECDAATYSKFEGDTGQYGQQANHKEAINNWYYVGWNNGSPAPTALWFVNSDFSTTSNIYSSGIANGFAYAMNKYSGGDLNANNWYINTKPYWSDASGEGVTGFRDYVAETASPLAGTLVSATQGPLDSSEPFTTITMHCTQNCAIVGKDHPFIDKAASAGAITSGLTGAVVSSSGGVVTMSVSGTTFTPSSCGTTTAQISTPAPGRTDIKTAESVSLTGLPSALTTGEYITIAGEFIETSTITSYGSFSGGNQTVTIPLMYAYPAGARVCAGGEAGGWYLDETASDPSGIHYLFTVVGSPASNELYVTALRGGSLHQDFITGGAIALYPGANITNAVDPGTGKPDGATFTIDTVNTAAWAASDPVENASQPSSIYTAQKINLAISDPYAVFSGGLSIGTTAATLTPFYSIEVGNSSPASSYVGHPGGSAQPSYGLYLAGTGSYANGLIMDGAPDGGSVLYEGNSVAPAILSVGDIPAGSSETSYDIFSHRFSPDNLRYTPGSHTFSFSGNLGVSGAAQATSYQETLYTPASSSAACTAGQFADDANYHYVCVATNTWKRVALSSF